MLQEHTHTRTRRASRLAVVLIASTLPGVALAQADDERPPGMAAGGSSSDSDDVRYVDANVDRTIMFTSGETHPKGTFYFSNYELFLFQFGYAFTDVLQGSVTTLPPYVEEQPYFFDLALKLNVARTDEARVALFGALDILFDDDGHSFVGGRVGGAAQFCFEPRCWSSLTLGAGTFLSGEVQDFFPITFTAGLTGRVSRVVALLLEPTFLAAVNDTEVQTASVMLLNYGIRLSEAHWGLDISFIRPVVFGEDVDLPFILGIPFVSFTYRSDWEAPGGGSTSAAHTAAPSRASEMFVGL